MTDTCKIIYASTLLGRPMKKTILIPTDFSIESLKLLKEAVTSVEVGSVNIIFLHCIYLSDSIFDLLFFSKKEWVESLVNKDFDDGCKIIRNKYVNKINSARVEFFTGTTQQAFDNFLEGNQVDEIMLPKNYVFKQSSKKSFSPEPYIRKSRLPLIEVVWQKSDKEPEKNSLAEIFLL